MVVPTQGGRLVLLDDVEEVDEEVELLDVLDDDEWLDELELLE